MKRYEHNTQLDQPSMDEGDETFTGVNNRLAPELLPPGVLAEATNVRMRTGQIADRLGVIKPAWLNVTQPGVNNLIAPVGQWYGVGVFKDPSTIEWVFQASDGFIFRCKPGNARVVMPLPTGVKILSACSFCQAFNKMYCFRGKYLQPLVLNNVDTGFVDVIPRWDMAGLTSYQALVLATQTPAQEVAYGPWESVASLTSVADKATVVTPFPHGYVTGADVVIQGAAPLPAMQYYNGRFNITVIDEITFTYQFHGGASPATGTITVSNMSAYWRALGTMVTLTDLRWTGGVATGTTAAPHGFSVGQYVTIAGATPVGFNGTWVIQTVTSTTFTLAMPTAPSTGTPPIVASGTITAQTSVVLAGQSPSSNPEAWTPAYNILPNADDALYMNNRLLVPTAWTPGNLGYDSTSTYTKKDFIAATDSLDPVHVDFSNAFRINQGSDDEIVGLVKYNETTAIVWKEKSWGILSNIAIDLSNLTLDMREGAYGSCAPRAQVVAGVNAIFASKKRGLCALQQNDLGKTRSLDTPWSNDLQGTIDRINWNQASHIRLAWWDDKLYAAVPIDNAGNPGPELVPPGTYPGSLVRAQVAVGYTYTFIKGPNEVALVNGPEILTASGDFVAADDSVGVAGTPYATITASVKLKPRCNNAILVYDFRLPGKGSAFTYDFQSGQWQGYDDGSEASVMEFFKATWNGVERLFYLAENGYANCVEESTSGCDEVQAAPGTTSTGLTWAPIQSNADTRGYRLGPDATKSFKRMETALGVWDSNVSVSAFTARTSELLLVRDGISFSRTKYLKPAGRKDYTEGNLNGDFDEPGRGNYSVYLMGSGIGIAEGQSLQTFQEIIVRGSVRTRSGRFMQLNISKASGRLLVKSVGMEGDEGWRRDGIIV